MARRQAQDRTKNVRLNESKPSTAASGPLAEEARSQKAANGTTMVLEVRDRIETLAYELYLRRGRQDGYDKHDWLEAERMTLIQNSASPDNETGTPRKIPV